MLVHIGILLHLASLIEGRALKQVTDGVALVYLVKLATIVTDVFEVQPDVQEQTYDTYTGEEEGGPEETVT